VRSVPGLWLMMGGLLAAQEPMEMGPVPTREMFPLYLITQGYQPVDPTPLGSGRWRVDLERIQSNTFEFSGIFKTQPVQDIEGRVRVTREFVEAHAAEYRDLPLVFFFDEEITRTTLRVRHGIGEATDLWAEWPFQSHSGGRLDHLVEAFHSLGFEQYGRDLVVKDQLTLVVMERGELRFYSDHGIRGKPQDPVIGLTHRLFAHDSRWPSPSSLPSRAPMTCTVPGGITPWPSRAAGSPPRPTSSTTELAMSPGPTAAVPTRVSGPSGMASGPTPDGNGALLPASGPSSSSSTSPAT
jgi:hypothetical protein